VNHRINSALPDYLMIASTKATHDLIDLSAEALGSIGTVFAKVQRALNALGARGVYISNSSQTDQERR
jgi:diadenosine tetraphosphate (Ap4A) HIT family hydrolase